MKTIHLLATGIVVLAVVLPMVRTDAATRTFQTAGNWSAAANWQGSIKPATGDDIVIAANCTVDEDISALIFGTVTIGTGINFNLMQYSLDFTGSVTNDGFIHTQCTANNPLPSGKTWGGYVYFEATAGQIVPVGTYYALKASASGSSRTVAAGGDITVTRELYVEGFTNANQAIFDMKIHQLSGKPTATYVSGKLRTANTGTAPLPSGMRWYSNIVMRQGVVEFYATAPQCVPGGTYDDDVIMTGGTKSLTGTMYSNSTLTLMQSVLVIVDSNLVIGTGGSIQSGLTTFSASNMVAISGSGFLTKRFSNVAAFTYPIGDITGTPEYSPATLQFTTATGSMTASVRVVNAKHPLNGSTSSYINRYWTVDALSTGTGSGSVSFTYTNADIVGPEASMYTGQRLGAAWVQRNKADTATNKLSATGIALTGDFTGGVFGTVLPCVVDVKILLQGPASPTTGTMSTALNTGSLLPLHQPYDTPPWNYSGTESVTTIPSNTIVDWVLIELRSTPTGAAVATRAGFVHSNGHVTDIDGARTVSFSALAAGSYYIVLRHRNHLSVMTSAAVAISSATALYDFTSDQGQAYGTEPMTGLNAGLAPFALWAGDANADGRLAYTGASNDPDAIMSRIGGSDITATHAGYRPEDTSMDGVVKYSGSGNDRAIILRNIGGVNIGNVRTSQVP